MQMALIFQMIIVPVYWTMIHEQDVVPKFGDKPRLMMFMYWVHIWPGIAALFNVIISKSLFINSYYKFLLGVGVFYMFVNFVGTKVSGKPLYSFLPWTDWTSLVISMSLIGLALLSYYLVCNLVNYSKLGGKSLSKPKTKQ